MITLYVFGPNFGLPDPSPFVLKTEVQLKMAGVPYRTAIGQLPEAPKGKLPYIVDGTLTLGDSTFIRTYLEQKSGIDLDGRLDARQRALGWAVERTLEDHLYWAILQHRWIDPDNFARGPAHFFDGAPEAMRDKLRADAQGRVRERLHGHGLGRHSPAEIGELGARSLASLSTLLGEQPYLFGAEPKAADATAFAMVAAAAVPLFAGPLADAAQSDRRLMAYRDRMLRRFYPDFAAAA
jgi:glutathione S-transferase